MTVPVLMTDLSATAASNSPAGSEVPSSANGPDDFIRAIAAILRQTNTKGSDIASAGTTNIGAATGSIVDVTGTTTITALGTIAAGIWRIVRFTGALTLTHNSSSLILPGAVNITTANGDVAIFISLGSGNWYCASYQTAAGFVPPARTITAAGLVTGGGTLAADRTVTVTAASQADQETGTSTTTAVTPSIQIQHPSACKAWAKVTVSGGVPTLAAAYKFTSVTDGGVGVYTMNLPAGYFSSANYAVLVSPYSTTITTFIHASAATAAAVTVSVFDTAGNPADQGFSIACFGDL